VASLTDDGARAEKMITRSYEGEDLSFIAKFITIETIQRIGLAVISN